MTTDRLPGLDITDMFPVKVRRKRCEKCRVLQQPQLLINGACASCALQQPLPLFTERVKST